MKRWIPLLLSIVLILCFSLAAFASQPKIVDEAGLLTDTEITALEHKAQALSEKYQTDIVIVTVYSLDGKSSDAYADDYFDYNGYGIGSDHSGILFLVSMEYRDWAVSTCGKTIGEITNRDSQDIVSGISEHLSQGEYYLAFDGYLDSVNSCLESSINSEKFQAKDFLIALAVGIAVAGITLLVMRGKMNTAKAQRGAASYLKAGTYALHRQSDIFLYSNIHKVRRAENNGGSTHRSSSGRSHGGSRGKF